MSDSIIPSQATAGSAAMGPGANGGNRQAGAKVAPHIQPAAQAQVRPASVRPMNIQSDQTAAVGGARTAMNAAPQQAIPAIDWNLLANVNGAATEFLATNLGQFLKNIANAYANGVIDVKFDQQLGAFVS